MLVLSYKETKYIDIMHEIILRTINVLQESCHVKIYISYYGVILLHLSISYTIFQYIYRWNKTVLLLYRE